MLVFWREKLTILAVPKTGSTALETALKPFADMTFLHPPEIRHAPAYRYNRFLRPMFDRVDGADMETLAVVREPLSWLQSWYRYRQRDDLIGRPASTRDIDFDSFVLGYLKGEKPAYSNVGSQANFINGPDGKPRVTHLFRYEDQPGLLAFLQERLDRKITLPRRNASPAVELTLSEKIARRLYKKCAVEFNLWESIPRSGLG